MCNHEHFVDEVDDALIARILHNKTFAQQQIFGILVDERGRSI